VINLPRKPRGLDVTKAVFRPCKAPTLEGRFGQAEIARVLGKVRVRLGPDADRSLDGVVEMRLLLSASRTKGVAILFDERGFVQRVSVRGKALIDNMRDARHLAQYSTETFEKNRSRLYLNYMEQGRAQPWWPVADMADHLEGLLGRFWSSEVFDITFLNHLGPDVDVSRTWGQLVTI